MLSRIVRAAGLLLVIGTGTFLSGCADDNTEPEAASAPEPAAEVLDDATNEVTDFSGAAFSWGGVTATVPEDWQEEAPENSMRKAQFRLKRAEGDEEDVSVVLTYFGVGQGGSLHNNKMRWAGMIEPVGDQSAMDSMKIETTEMGEIKLTTADLAGKYVAAIDMFNPGAGKHSKPNYRLYNAVIESPLGSHYVKVLGPQKSMEKWMPSIKAFLKSAKVKS